MTVAAGTARYVRHQQRFRDRVIRLKEADEFKRKKEAWVVDTDDGDTSSKRSALHSVNTMDVELLRKLFEEEIERCLTQESCVEDQTHRLELEVDTSGRMDCARIGDGLHAVDEQVLTGTFLPGASAPARGASSDS